MGYNLIKEHKDYGDLHYPEAKKLTWLQIIEKVNNMLNFNECPNGVLHWWLQPNARLKDNARPCDLLEDSSCYWVIISLAENAVEDSG